MNTKRVEKPWGRRSLWPGFEDVAAGGEPVGEIWFDGGDLPLMVKYLFTSERLSVQVHPNDDQARSAGFASGKDEAWIILAAEPDATIGLGLRHAVSRDELRAAAQDGSIVDLVDWRQVRSGDVIYSPAGTVHAIGPGLTLIEVQQNVDLTYRLFDYGRPRALHLDEGIAVSDPARFDGSASPGGDRICDGPKLRIDRWHGGGARALDTGWLIPVAGGGLVDGQRFRAGECWYVDDAAEMVPDVGADVLFAAAKG